MCALAGCKGWLEAGRSQLSRLRAIEVGERKHAHLARENSATGRLRFCSSAPVKDAIGLDPQPRNCSRRQEPGQAGLVELSCIHRAIEGMRRRRLTPLALALLSIQWHMEAFSSGEVATHAVTKDSRFTSIGRLYQLELPTQQNHWPQRCSCQASPVFPSDGSKMQTGRGNHGRASAWPS